MKRSKRRLKKNLRHLGKDLQRESLRAEVSKEIQRRMKKAQAMNPGVIRMDGPADPRSALLEGVEQASTLDRIRNLFRTELDPYRDLFARLGLTINEDCAVVAGTRHWHGAR